MSVRGATAGTAVPQLPVINMLWIGPRLGPLERACMRSVMAAGHSLNLWCYDRADGAPEGTILRDADEILPRESVFSHVQTGSFSLFSNLFRHMLLQRGEGIWLDCDVYLLKPISLNEGYALGWEEPDLVGTAILCIPPDCAVLEELISYFSADRVPPWLPLRWKLRFGWQTLLTGSYRLETMPWGYLGPQAMTYMVKKHGLAGRVRPQHVFSPWGYREARWILEPGVQLEDRIMGDTVAAHLFNQMIRDFKDQPAPEDSFLARLHHEGA